MVHQFLYGLDDTHFHTIRSSLTYRVSKKSTTSSDKRKMSLKIDILSKISQRSRRLQLRRDFVTKQRIEKDRAYVGTVIVEGIHLITASSS